MYVFPKLLPQFFVFQCFQSVCKSHDCMLCHVQQITAVLARLQSFVIKTATSNKLTLVATQYTAVKAFTLINVTL